MPEIAFKLDVKSRFQNQIATGTWTTGQIFADGGVWGGQGQKVGLNGFRETRRTGHDMAMTPEDLSRAPHYRNNLELSVEGEESAQAKKGMEGEAAVLLDPVFQDAFADFCEPEKLKKDRAGKTDFGLFLGVQRGMLQAWFLKIFSWIRKHTFAHYKTMSEKAPGGCS